MTGQLSDLLQTEHVSAVLMTALSALALFLAASGLYGVVAYTTAQRTGEMGLRMALGARAGDVLQLVLRDGAVLIAIGLAIGGAAARGLGAALADALFDVTPGDPATFAAVAALVAAISLAACYIPARRATLVDPLTALKAD